MSWQAADGSAEGRSHFTTLQPTRATPDTFKLAKPDFSDTHFDSAAAFNVPAKVTPEYTIVVRPKMNGQDVGWFILSSGCDGLYLNKDIAGKLGMSKVGEIATTGRISLDRLDVWRAKTFALGGLTIDNPIVYGTSVPPGKPLRGEPLVGECGFDVFARSIVTMRPYRQKVEIFPVDHDMGIPNDQWIPFEYDIGGPCIKASLEGHEGMYVIDMTTLDFLDVFAPAVQRMGLLNHREIQDGAYTSASQSSPIKQGTIGNFEAGQSHATDVTAEFGVPGSGTYFLEPYVDGAIGMKMLRGNRIVFDYPHQRIAILN